VLFGVLLIFCGVNVSLDALPDWMAAVGSWLPLTHAIQAARELAAGGSLGSVAGLIGQEVGLGVLYGGVGLAALLVRDRGPPASHPRDPVMPHALAPGLKAGARACGRFGATGCT
jgi:hypothetical protein